MEDDNIENNGNNSERDIDNGENKEEIHDSELQGENLKNATTTDRPYPPEDKEMPLSMHIKELRDRLVRVLISVAVLFAIFFPFSDDVMVALWYRLFAENIDIVAYSPPEWIISRLILSLFVSILVAFPYLIYETYMYLKPGLFHHERKYLKYLIPMSYLLFIGGVSLAFFVIVPRVLDIVIAHSGEIAPEFSVQKTMMGLFRIFFAFGLVFQLPIPMVLAVRIGIVTPEWFEKRRLVVYGLLAVLATTISPDFTGVNQLIILGIVGLLYELSIKISRLFVK
jgi:sec-independent protein translocase protein TatC